MNRLKDFLSSKPGRISSAVFVLAILIGLYFPITKTGTSSAGQESAKSVRPSVDGTEAGAEENTATRKPREEQAPHDERLKKLSKASRNVIADLSQDEFLRTKLISKTENDQSTSFLFEISASPDMEKFFEDKCRQRAEEAGVNYLAVKKNAAHFLGDYKIPKGSSQKLQVNVPKDPSQDVTHTMVTSPDSDDPAKISKATGSVTFGRVSSNRSGWRYKNILDLN